MALKLQLILMALQQKNKGKKIVYIVAFIILFPIVLLLMLFIFLFIAIFSSIFSVFQEDTTIYQQAIDKVVNKYNIENHFSSKSLRCIDIFMDGGESDVENLSTMLEQYFIEEEIIVIVDKETEEETVIKKIKFLEQEKAKNVLMSSPFNFTQEYAQAVFTIPLMYGGSGQFLKPMENARVTSGYGYRQDPFTGEQSFHKGIDMVSPINNAPIFSVADGTVYSTPSSNVGGNMLIIKHSTSDGGVIYSFYAHLATVNVQAGDTVYAGQVVATEGGGKNDPNPGSSTGQHLHFEMRTTPSPESHINPEEYIGSF